jgi:hypothetical protein
MLLIRFVAAKKNLDAKEAEIMKDVSPSYLSPETFRTSVYDYVGLMWGVCWQVPGWTVGAKLFYGGRWLPPTDITNGSGYT